MGQPIDASRAIFRTHGCFDEIDETWSEGSYIGGMAGAHQDAGIAASYKRAADAVVERSLADDCAYEMVMPALFLYRHALELRLKIAVRPEKLHHDVAELGTQLDALLVQKRGIGLPQMLLDHLRDFGRHDPGGDAFRFHSARPRKSATQRSGDTHFPEEIWVDLAHLRSVFDWIDCELKEAARILSSPV